METRGLPRWLLQARGLPHRGAGQPRVGPTIDHGGAGVGRNHTAAAALQALPLEDVDAPLVGLMGGDANDRERGGGQFPFLKAGRRYSGAIIDYSHVQSIMAMYNQLWPCIFGN